MTLLHSAKYLKPQSQTRYAAPAYCYCKWKYTKGVFPKGPKEQILAWNENNPSFSDAGQKSAAVISLLDAVTEDLSMVNSLLKTPIISRRDFGPVFKRVEYK